MNVERTSFMDKNAAASVKLGLGILSGDCKNPGSRFKGINYRNIQAERGVVIKTCLKMKITNISVPKKNIKGTLLLN